MAKVPKSEKPVSTGKKLDMRGIAPGSQQTWFKPGQSGNPVGRPEGSKNRVNEDFLGALADDFAVHGPTAIVQMREKDPGGYIRVVAALVPTESKVDVTGADAFVKIWGAIASGTLAAMLDDVEGRGLN